MERVIGCPNTIKTVTLPFLAEPRKLWIGMSHRKNIQAALTSFSDSVLNQLFFYVPCFYLLTGVAKGQTISYSCDRLQSEYLSACLGQASFWLPVQFCNFRFVPVHLQTFVVSICNVANKTWLSWLSNRERQSYQQKELEVAQLEVEQLEGLMSFHNDGGSSAFVDEVVDTQSSASESDNLLPTHVTLTTQVPPHYHPQLQVPHQQAAAPAEEEHHYIDKDQLYATVWARSETVQCEEPAERSSQTNRGFPTGAEHEMLHR
jgi:hypothetical protein